MKKLFAVLLALAMILSMAACGQTEEDEETSVEETTEETTGWVWDGIKYDELKKTMGKADVDLSNADGLLAEILQKGTLTIATSPDYPPAEFVDVETGEVKGYEILMAQYIANSLGVELVVETMDFNAVLTAVDTGKVDLGISGFGYKADRAEQYELSHGYQTGTTTAHHTIVVLAENKDKYNSLDDFTGKTIDAQANSLQEMYVTDQIKDANLQLVTSIDQSILELMGGKVDAVALDSTTARQYAEQSEGKIVSLYEEKKLEFDLSLYNDYAGNVCAVKKGETSLMDAINQVIDSILENDMYTNMYYSSCDAAGVTPDEE